MRPSATRPQDCFLTSVSSSSNTEQSRAEPDADAAFRQARREFRRYVGKSIGSLSAVGSGARYRVRWCSLVAEHGEEAAVEAVKLWAQELGKGGRNLNFPLAVFLNQASEYLEAAHDAKNPPKAEDEFPDL
jgi:hypothetical protein